MNYEKESIEATVERLYHICEQMNGMIGTNIYMLEAICDKFNLDFEKEFTLASLAMEARVSRRTRCARSLVSRPSWASGSALITIRT